MRALALAALFLACTNHSPMTTNDTTTNAPFTRYVSLGDSISIDSYPAADVARRHAGRASTTDLGAASLLYRNDDKLWPGFRGRDLRSFFPSIQHDDLTSDGATTHTLLYQVARVERSEERTLMTITIGGNDLLGSIGGTHDPVPAISGRLREAVTQLLDRRPNSLILVSTVYDPSDDTKRLPGYSRTLDREAGWLAQYHDAMRALVASDPRLKLADIYSHFLGHGMTVPPAQRWYLEESIIEPNARGASEVRRVWLEALGR